MLINYAFRDAVLALPAPVSAAGWEVAFPKGAALPFVPVKAGAKPGVQAGMAPAQVKLAAQQVLILKAH